MSDPDFGIEVPEADRLEQLREAAPDPAVEDDGRGEAPVLDPGTADPADVLDQHLEVPAGEDEDW